MHTCEGIKTSYVAGSRSCLEVELKVPLKCAPLTSARTEHSAEIQSIILFLGDPEMEWKLLCTSVAEEYKQNHLQLQDSFHNSFTEKLSIKVTP